MIHGTFIFRQIKRSSRQAVLFVLCVILSITTLTAFSGFSYSVNRSLLSDARKLHAADIIIRSYEKISGALDSAVKREIEQGLVERTTYYEFFSVVRAVDDQTSMPVQIKIVERAYPYYGEVRLASGRGLHDVLRAGQIVVAQGILDGLGLKPGDRLKVGYTTLTIADVVLSEPDRPVNLFAFGPRIFVAAADLNAVGLIEKGSRIRHVYLLKAADSSQLTSIVERLRGAALQEQESVETFRSARSVFKRFLDNFIYFLKQVGLFILVIAGFGIQGTLTALLNEKQGTIAVMKTVGATNSFITRHYILIVIILGAIGTVIGISAGIGLQYALARMLVEILPPDMQLGIAWSGVLEGICLGLIVVSMFSFIPLYRLKGMRPVMILRKERIRQDKKWPYYLSAGVLVLFFFALVLWHMEEVKVGLYFVGGTGALIAASWLMTHLMLWGLKRLSIRRLSWRQAARGLFRPGNATKAIMVTLTASLAAIFMDFLIEQNLDATFIKSYPPESPNVFFIDIQPHQLDAFSEAVDGQVQYFPVIRAKVVSVNGEKIDRSRERKKRRDNLGRMFNLTYREHLLQDEEIIAGKELFRKDWQEVQVSIMDTVTEMRSMNIGDTITFKIQGVPLKARISSVRSRSRESFSPFFYFVFQEKVLREAPQSVFTALKVEPGDIGPLRSRIVSRFPNISVIDLSESLQVFGGLLKRLSRIIRFFSMLSIAAGILIMISAIYATRAARITESVYYKILGARQKFVMRVFAMENLMMALFSGLLALLTAQTATWLSCRFFFDIPYRPFLATCVLMLIATIAVIVLIGLVSSLSILAKKPVAYLREQTHA